MRLLRGILSCCMGVAWADSAVLGVGVARPDAGVRQVAGQSLPVGQGLVVVYLVPGSSAAAFLQPGDVLVSVDGTSLHNKDELSRVVQQKKPGDTVLVVLLRHGDQMSVVLRLDGRPDTPELSPEQHEAVNRLLLLLVPHDENAAVDVPAVRRQLLLLAELGLATRNSYATCQLYFRQGNYLLAVRSTDRMLSITSNAPQVPNVLLRADFYRRDQKPLPVKLRDILLQSEYYKP